MEFERFAIDTAFPQPHWHSATGRCSFMSLATQRSLYGKLAADSTLNALLAAPASGHAKSIYHEIAPQNATLPYVVFNEQSGTPSYTMTSVAFDDELWTVKGIASGQNAQAAITIADRLNTLLTDASLSISGKVHRLLRRESDVQYAEDIEGVIYRHAGALYRLIYTSP